MGDEHDAIAVDRGGNAIFFTVTADTLLKEFLCNLKIFSNLVTIMAYVLICGDQSF